MPVRALVYCLLLSVLIVLAGAAEPLNVDAWLKATTPLQDETQWLSGYLPIENLRYGALAYGVIAPATEQLTIEGFSKAGWRGMSEPVWTAVYDGTAATPPSITWTCPSKRQHLRILVSIVDQYGKGSTGEEVLGLYHNDLRIGEIKLGARNRLSYNFPYSWQLADEEGVLPMECQFEEIRRIPCYGYVTRERRIFQKGETLRLQAETPGRYQVNRVVLVPRPDTIDIHEPAILYPEVKQWPDGHTQIAWVTRLPARCTLLYGTDRQVVADGTAPRYAADRYGENHQQFLPLEPPPGETLYYRILAEFNDGRRLASQLRQWTAPAAAPQTRTGRLVLRAHEEPPAPGTPAWASVPLPQGELLELNRARLLADGAAVPAQFEVVSVWPDGSIRFLGVAFSVRPGASYEVEWGPLIEPPKATGLVVTEMDNAIRVRDEDREWLFSAAVPGGLASTPLPGPLTLYQTGPDGTRYAAGPPESIAVERSGPFHAVVRVDGHFQAGEATLFAYTCRWHLHAGYPGADLEFTFGNDLPDIEKRRNDTVKTITYFRNIYLELPAPGTTCQAAVDGELAALSNPPDRLFQLDENTVALPGGRHPGRWTGLAVAGDDAPLALRLENAWQQYPKSIERSEGVLRLGLLPDYEEADYPYAEDRTYIKLFYYLRHGQYRIMHGVQKTHRIALTWGPGAVERLAEQRLLMSRVFLTPEPDAMCRSRVFGRMIPPDPAYQAIEDFAAAQLDVVLANRDANREYGLLNFGDWFGERNVNWGNLEYDLGQGASQEFLRTGNADWLQVAVDAVTHQTDVDQVHYGRNRGLQVMHAACHTGREYFNDDGISHLEIKKIFSGHSAPYPQVFHAGHAWCAGIANVAAITGSPRLRAMLDEFAEVRARQATVSMPPDQNHRGWDVIALSHAYSLTANPYYLNGARILVDRYRSVVNPINGVTYASGGEHNTIGFIHRYALLRYGEVSSDPTVPALLAGTFKGMEGMWDNDYASFMAAHHGFPVFRRYGPPFWLPFMAAAWRQTGDPVWRERLDLYLACNLGNLSSASKTASTYLQFASLWTAALKDAGIDRLPAPHIPDHVRRCRAEGGRRGFTEQE